MEMIVLAGGMGTRLKSAVKEVPKPMADINGEPFLEYLLRYLAQFKIGKIILSVGYKYEIIQNYFKNDRYGIEIVYAVERTPLGTGGAIKASLQYVEKENAVVLNGDTFFKVNINEIYERHLSNRCDVTLALKPMKNFDRYGAVVVKNNRVVSFEEKAAKDQGYINGGIYVLRRSLLDKVSEKDSFSFENDYLQKNVNELNICPYISDNYFIDIGIPTDYHRARLEL